MGLNKNRGSEGEGNSEENLVYLTKFSNKLNVRIVVEGERTSTKDNQSLVQKSMGI